MAKSLRSKRKRKMRRERREKFKVKETERLLETLGINAKGKEEAMLVTVENKEPSDCSKQETVPKSKEHVVEILTQDTSDIEMDEEKTQQNNNTTKKKVNRKQLLKRLGKKKKFKKGNKKIKW